MFSHWLLSWRARFSTLATNQEIEHAGRAEEHEATLNLLVNEWLGYEAMRIAGHLVPHGGSLRSQVLDEFTHLKEMLGSGTPEAIAATLMSAWCGDRRSEAFTQQRYAAIWSAILTPMVAYREHANSIIKPEDLVSAGKDWLFKSGHTRFSQYCDANRAVRRLASHSHRSYQLVFDSAVKANVDPAKLLASLVLPILQPMLVALTIAEQNNSPISSKATSS